MKKFTILLTFLTYCTFSFAQLNVSYVGDLPYDEDLSDIWGYVAPDGTEYAIVGVRNGVSIVNLSDPANPVESDFLPGPSTTWRDIKTWGTHAYVTNETSNGVLVIDLSNLPGEVTAFDWTPNIPGLGTISSCHNIFIDELGYAYLAGCNINNGGVIYVDVFSEPGNPQYAGAGPPVYSHDVYTRDNIMYSSEIGAGVFSIYNTADKNATLLLGSHPTEALATHNAWLSDDSNILFTTDETGNGPVGSYDVSDPADIKELDQFRPIETLGDGVIPHNVHVWNDWLIVSYYTDGCIIVDGSRPENLVEVGNFDTFIPAATGFLGAWGAYPFLPSGLILIADIGNGLYILQPNYVRACYLEGTVTDAVSGNGITGAQVSLVGELAFDNSNPNGEYKTGIATAGSYDVEVRKPGYEPFLGSAKLTNGEITILNVQLNPLPSFAISGQVIDAGTGEPVAEAKVEISNQDFQHSLVTDASGNFTINTFFEGSYEVFAGKWGYKTAYISQQDFDENNASATIEIETGIEDIFSLDLGWTVEGNAPQGLFERGTPIELTVQPAPGFDLIVQPGEDAAEDVGNHCYVTGNSDNLQGGVLIGGFTRLTSPIFDATAMTTPILSYQTWFLNVNTNGQGPGNDAIIVRIDNGTESVEVDRVIDETLQGVPQAWRMNEVNMADTIEITTTMRVIFEILDTDFNDVSEGLVDYFQVYDATDVSAPTIQAEAFELTAFPNPSSHNFTIDYQIKDWSNGTQLLVYNILGQVVETVDLENTTDQLSIGNAWSKGIYFIQIQQANKSSEPLKIIKQ